MKYSYFISLVGACMLFLGHGFVGQGITSNTIAYAQSEQKIAAPLGIHILGVHEFDQAAAFLDDIQPDSDDHTDEATDQPQDTGYLTIPFALSDLDSLGQWQDFFTKAKKHNIIPLVRLVTEFRDGAWQPPTRKQIVDQLTALESLDWPQEQKHIIIFNEVNHAAEWGGTINPATYAEVLLFTSQWAQTSQNGFVVLPAAMDLAAPNGPKTMEAFTYLEKMLAAHPDVFDHIDVWNSHSYPNPAFSAPANRTGQNSLRGFEHELAFLDEKLDRTLPVMITETGWQVNARTRPHLKRYYQYALQNIWNDERILAVTPFILKGDPGPFAEFGFIDRNDQPTAQYIALKEAIAKEFSLAQAP